MSLSKPSALRRVNSSDMATVAACVFVFAAAIISYAVDRHLSDVPLPPDAPARPAAAQTARPADHVDTFATDWRLRGALAPDDNPLRNRETRRLKTLLATAE